MQRANKRKFHYVYRIDRDDGKYYIGLHSTDLLEDGYFGSGTYLANSLRYHGRDKHSKTILQFFDTRDEAKAHEKFLITEEMRCDKLCMNIAAHRLKAQSKGGIAGGRASFEKGKGFFSKESKAKSVATKKAKYETGELVGTFTGRKHLDETKALIGLKAKTKVGELNSQYGTCWITDGVKPVKISKEKLDEYLAKGFIRGRK
jgi:hypothetical protein